MIRLLTVLVCLFGILGTVPAWAQNTVTLEGDLSVEEEDANGIVTKVSIVYWDDSGDFRSCIVGQGLKGKELIALIEKQVRVTGTVKDVDGACTITVKSYEVIESSGMDEEEDAGDAEEAAPEPE